MDTKQEDSRVVIIETDKPQMIHKFGGFYVKDQNVAFYIGKNNDIRVPGKTLVEAGEHFFGKVLRSAIVELNTYLCERMSEQEMYGTEAFWKDALKYAGITIAPHSFWMDFRPAPYGYFFMHTSDSRGSCAYNFIDNSFSFQPNKDKSASEQTLMEFCYHGILDQLLAQRQADAGTAPQAYMEIARINGFLKNKRSVHCVFNNGKSYQSYSRDPFRADSLIKEENGKFVINPYGYSVVPPRGTGLPIKFRYYAFEFPLDTRALEQLNVEIDDANVKNARKKEDFRTQIAGMISPGSWYPFCKVELKTKRGHSVTLLHPSNPDTRDDLLKMDKVQDFLCQYCDEDDLSASIINCSVGSGNPAPMPPKMFKILELLGSWAWNSLSHFSEGAAHTVTFDVHFLYDHLYGKNKTNWEKTYILLLNKILASIPDDVCCDFSMVRATGENCEAASVVAGNICDEGSVKELPFFRALCEKYPDEKEFYVVSRCFHAGSGASTDMPEELLLLVKEFDVENFISEDIVKEDAKKEIHVSLPGRGGDDDNEYGGGIATDLMPESIRKKLLKSPIYSKDGQGKKAEVVVKYFDPTGSGTWLITEGEAQDDGDWLMFGMCHIFEWEWGYVLLSELQNVKLPLGLRIERDLHSHGTVGELMGEPESKYEE